MKYSYLFLLASINAYCCTNLYAQSTIINEYAYSGYYEQLTPAAKNIKYTGKKLPPGYEQEAAEALQHFPELKNVPICFKTKNSKSTLKTKPSFVSMFLPRGHRRYVIIISNKSAAETNALLLKNLPYTARVGVLGHELSHVADFSQQTFFQSFQTALHHLSKHSMDKMENATDHICINHGLGNQLEAWSMYVRETMHTVNWRGAAQVKKGESPTERYMNPRSIEQYMQQQGMLISPTGIAH